MGARLASLRRPRYGNTYRHVWRSWWRAQRVARGHRYSRECDWCGGEQVWYRYKQVSKAANGRFYGRWTCTAYGQCEAAPG